MQREREREKRERREREERETAFSLSPSWGSVLLGDRGVWASDEQTRTWDASATQASLPVVTRNKTQRKDGFVETHNTRS
jgi:hypothetical protein